MFLFLVLLLLINSPCDVNSYFTTIMANVFNRRFTAFRANSSRQLLSVSSSWLPGSSASEKKPWYVEMNGAATLPFNCTGCGKCCKTKGTVIMSPEEVKDAATLLNITLNSFRQNYVAKEQQLDSQDDVGWIKLKDDKNLGGCIFLDHDTNHCKIYEARPLQCYAYPFWPRIMESK